MYEQYPQFEYDRKKHKGRLVQEYTFQTSLYGHYVLITKAELLNNGKLICHKGCVWDFGTGAIDTVAMVVSSLEHDLLRRMIDQDVLSPRLTKRVDRDFKSTLRYWTNGKFFEYHWSNARYQGVRAYTKVKEWFL